MHVGVTLLGADLNDSVRSLRNQLEAAFSPETAAKGFSGQTPSTGHCAAVAIIVREILGGEFVSASVNGASHWFNRIATESCVWDIDLTADQFGNHPVEMAKNRDLYPGTRLRSHDDVNLETLIRAKLLAHRAGLIAAEVGIQDAIHGSARWAQELKKFVTETEKKR